MPDGAGPTIDDALLDRLRAAAKAALPRSYPRYSGFIVLAAVETVAGEVYGGANVEVANYSLTKHAEEAAVMGAIAAGVPLSDPWLRSIYVIGGAPCGSCRQFLWEFALSDAVVVVDEEFGRMKQPVFLRNLLPDPFGPADLDVDHRPGTPPKGLSHK